MSDSAAQPLCEFPGCQTEATRQVLGHNGKPLFLSCHAHAFAGPNKPPPDRYKLELDGTLQGECGICGAVFNVGEVAVGEWVELTWPRHCGAGSYTAQVYGGPPLLRRTEVQPMWFDEIRTGRVDLSDTFAACSARLHDAFHELGRTATQSLAAWAENLRQNPPGPWRHLRGRR